jgi:hypothetical protein
VREVEDDGVEGEWRIGRGQSRVKFCRVDAVSNDGVRLLQL